MFQTHIAVRLTTDLLHISEQKKMKRIMNVFQSMNMSRKMLENNRMRNKMERAEILNFMQEIIGTLCDN